MSNTETVIELGKRKKVTVRKFNGMNLVDIREFYDDKASGESKPGKKGISLTEDVWSKLMESRDEIEAALRGLGGKRVKKEEKEEKEKEEKEKEEKEKEKEKEEKEEKEEQE